MTLCDVYTQPVVVREDVGVCESLIENVQLFLCGVVVDCGQTVGRHVVRRSQCLRYLESLQYSLFGVGHLAIVYCPRYYITIYMYTCCTCVYIAVMCVHV